MGPLKELRVKLGVKSKADPKYRAFDTELEKAIADLDGFVGSSLNTIYEFEALPLLAASTVTTPLLCIMSSWLCIPMSSLPCKVLSSPLCILSSWLCMMSSWLCIPMSSLP